VAFSPDGQMILSGCEDRSARLWDAATGELLREFKHRGYVQAVAFSMVPPGEIAANPARTGRACPTALAFRKAGPLARR
jgi:WD40 repeat protein